MSATKNDTEGKGERCTGSSFSFEKCQEIFEMMQNCRGGGKCSIDCEEMMQSMFVKKSEEEEKS